MLILFKLFGFINFEFMTILSFILGIFFGMVILSLLYALFVVASLGDKKYQLKAENDTLTEARAKEMIEQARRAFKDKNLRGKLSKAQHFRKLSYDLVYGIASSFYPSSKHPFFELTISETIELLDYVSKRLDEILDRKAIRLIKKFSISQIIDVSLQTKSVMDSKAFQVAKETKGAYNIFKKVVNVINPVTWFRVCVTDNAIRIVMNKLYLITLGIIGEEAFKIYSKKALNKEVEIDSGIEELVEEAQNEIVDIKKEAVKEYNDLTKEENNDSFLDNDNFKFKTKNYIVKNNYNYQSILDTNKKVKEKGNV